MQEKPPSAAGTRITLSLKGQAIEMDEIEHLRELFEARRRDFAHFSDLPHAELMEIVGVEPGATLSKVVEHRLEGNQGQRLGSDARDALEDAGILAIHSVYGALSEAEIWRLCYRLAYLVGYDIAIARQALKALEPIEKGRKVGGDNRWPRKWQRDYFRGLLPDICYDQSGNRRKQEDAAKAIRNAIRNSRTPPVPDKDVTGEAEIGKTWLPNWYRDDLGYKDWRHLPARLENWPDTYR